MCINHSRDEEQVDDDPDPNNGQKYNPDPQRERQPTENREDEHRDARSSFAEIEAVNAKTTEENS